MIKYQLKDKYNLDQKKEVCKGSIIILKIYICYCFRCMFIVVNIREFCLMSIE